VEDKANFVTSAKNGIVTVLYAYFPFGDIVACVKRETEHVNTSCALNAAAWSEVNPFFALNTITMMLLSSVVYKYICVLCVFAAFLLLLLLLLHSFCVSVLWWKCSFLGASGVCSVNLFVKTAHAQPLQIFSPEFLLAFVITSSEEEE